MWLIRYNRAKFGLSYKESDAKLVNVTEGKVEKGWKWGVSGLVILPLVFYAVQLLRIMAGTVGYPWELDQGEGHNVWSAWLLLHGRGPYLDLNHYPFFDINYPPLHFAMMIPFLWLFGPSLVAGRLLADLCVLGLAAGVGLSVWRYSRHNRIATVLASLLVLASPYLYIFGIIASVNVSHVMLGVWGLYCLGLALDTIGTDGTIVPNPKIRWGAFVGGLALLMAAFYTKQQAIDAVVAGFVFILWRRPKLAIVSGLIFGVIGGGLFLLIDLITTHQFYTNLIKLNINTFIKRQLLEQWEAYALTYGPILLLAVGYAILILRTEAKFSVWLIYLAATTLGSVLVGKVGASETYFYSNIAATAIAASLFVGWLIDNTIGLQIKSKRLWLNFGVVTLLLLCLQNVIFYHSPENPHPWKTFIKGHSGNYVLFGSLPNSQERAAGQRLADLVRAAPPPILTEEASFAMVNGYEVVTNPSNIMVFNQAKLWQGQELERMMGDRCFSLVLLHGQFLPEGVQNQMRANYSQIADVKLNGGDYYVWQRQNDTLGASCRR